MSQSSVARSRCWSGTLVCFGVPPFVADTRCRSPKRMLMSQQNSIQNMEMLSGTGSGVTLGNKSLWEERRLVSVARSGTIFWDAWTVEPNKQGIWRLIDGQSFEKRTALRMMCWARVES